MNVTEEDIKKIEEEYNLKCFFCSAKNGEKIEDAFVHLAREIMKTFKDMFKGSLAGKTLFNSNISNPLPNKPCCS